MCGLRRLIRVFLVGLLAVLVGNTSIALAVEPAWHGINNHNGGRQALFNAPLKYLPPSDAAIRKEEIIRADTSEWQEVNGSPAISLGLAEGDHWFYVEAENQSTTLLNAFLVIDNPLLDSVDVLLSVGDQPAMTIRMGDTVEFFQRFVENPAFLVPFSIAPGEDVKAYVRISNRDALKTNIYFVEQASYYQDSNTNHVLLLSMLTGMMALALYHFIFYFKTREISFLFFSFFVASAVFFFLVQSGFAYQWLWPNAPAWQNMSDPFSLGLMATFAVLFAISNLDMSSFSALALRNFILVIAACVLGCLISILLPYRISLLYMFFVYALVIGLGAWIGIRLWRQKQASYYMIAWGFLLLGSAVRLLYELAIIPQSAFSENAFLLGIALQVLFSGVGVAGKYNQEKQWRIDAQHSLLKEAQHVIEREKQLSDAQSSLAKLKQEQAERLEAHVQQRTQALEIALQELQNAKRQAEAADKQKTRFLAAASHDIRQPLNALSLMQESLDQTELSPPMLQNFAKMRRATQHLMRLFESLFDLSKLDNDLVAPSWEMLPIATSLKKIKDALQPLFAANGVQLHYSDDGCEHVSVRVDPIMLQRMLWILLDNALQHSHSKVVRLRLERVDAHYCIAIEDDGIGIPENELQNIFEEFYQLNNLQRDRAKGMGLGLALCKRLARLLNIELDVSSTLGQGTCFRLQLKDATYTHHHLSSSPMPADISAQWPGEALMGDPSTGEQTTGDRLRGVKVLVVEDDEDNRIATADLLTSWGMDSRIAEDAAQSWHRIDTQWQPDIVLIDFRLPGDCNGVLLANALLATLSAPPTIVIVSGEFDLPAQAEQYHFMRKPIKPSRLRAQLTGMMHQQMHRCHP